MISKLPIMDEAIVSQSDRFVCDVADSYIKRVSRWRLLCRIAMWRCAAGKRAKCSPGLNYVDAMWRKSLLQSRGYIGLIKERLVDED